MHDSIKDSPLRVLIVCALTPEAKPIIERFNLQHVQTEYGFKRYANKDGNLGLLISGVGKINIASALMWVQQFKHYDCYLNIGVMGHGSAEIGTCYLINKVVDMATNRAFYPSINFKWREAVSMLNTVDLPLDEYVEGQGVDMEASAFLQASRKFVTAEHAHLLKIVSDNRQSDYRQLNAVKVQSLIEENINVVEKILSLLSSTGIIKTDVFNDDFLRMQSKWHITESQKQQLFDVYQFVQVLDENTQLEVLNWRKYRTVKEYLAYLKLLIQTSNPSL
jgi:nucleoside phosphorylase